MDTVIWIMTDKCIKYLSLSRKSIENILQKYPFDN